MPRLHPYGLAVAWALSLLCTSPAQAAAANLVQNPSFELPLDQDGAPARGWRLTWNSAGAITVDVDRQLARSGAACQRMVVPEGGCRYPRLYQSVTVTAEAEYTFSCYARCEQGRLRVWISSKGWGREFGNLAVPAGAKWQRLTTSFRVGQLKQIKLLFLVLNPKREAETCWIDDVQLVQTGAPQAPRENLALSKPYELLTPRSYRRPTVSDHAILTDGQSGSGYWTRPNTLAWRVSAGSRSFVLVDLGEVQSIGSVGIASVHGRSAHPPKVALYTGETPELLQPIGEWDAGAGLPVGPDALRTLTSRSPDLNVPGRYVLFAMTQPRRGLVCVTELEVYRGARLAQRPVRSRPAVKLRALVESQDPLRFIPGVDTSVATPHIDWAPKLRGGPIRALTVVPYVCLRDAVELQQRLALEQRVFHLLRQSPRMGYFAARDLAAELRRPREVVILAGVYGSQLSANVQGELLRTVRAGAGLVWVNPKELGDRLSKAFAGLESRRFPVLASPLDQIPYPFLDELRSGAFGKTRCGRLGRGRVAVLEYDNPNRKWSTWGSGLFPECPPGHHRPEAFPYWEVAASYLCHIVRWAARGPASPGIESVAVRECSPDGIAVEVATDGPCSLVAEAWNETNRRVAAGRTSIAAGRLVRMDGPFQSGIHIVHVWATTDQGETADWHSALVRVPGPKISEVELDKPRYECGDTVTLSVNCEGPADALARARVTAELFDTYAGLVDTRKAAYRPGLSLVLDTSRSRSLAAKLWVRLTAGGRTVHERMSLVPTIYEPDLTEYTVGLWASYGSYVGKRFWGHSLLKAQIPLLADVAIAGPPEDYAEHDIRPMPENMHRIFFKGAKKYAEMNLCAPGFRDDFLGDIRTRAEASYRWGAFDFSVGDECGYTLRYDDHTAAAFRGYLKQKYGTLARLNAEWSTGHAAWQDVGLPGRGETVNPANIAKHLEAMLFSDTVFIDTLRSARDLVEGMDKRCRLGISGTREPAHYCGFDWWRLTRALTHLSFYDGLQREAIRSFRRPTDMTMSFVGYDSGDLNEPMARYFPWLELFNGFQGVAIYSASSGDVGGFLRPDLSLTRRAKWTIEEVAELKAGIGKALLTAQRTHSPIGVHYSQRSLWAAKLLGLPALANLTSVCEIIKDLGHQFDFVSHEQVESDVLRQRGYKVFVLPLSLSVSEAEAAGVRGFAEAGGTVLSVAPCSTFNEFGRGVDPGPLDRLLGIARRGPLAEAEAAALCLRHGSVSLTVSPSLPELALAPDAAVTHFAAGAVPALWEKPLGRGRVVGLNLLASGYREFRPTGVAGETIERVSGSEAVCEQYRALFDSLLERTGARRFAHVRRPDGTRRPYVEVVEFRRGPVRYVGLLPKYLGGRGYSGVRRVRVDPSCADAVRVDLLSLGHVYDVRRHTYLGRKQVLPARILPSVALLYAVLPYRVESVTVAVPEEVSPGERVTVRCTVAGSRGPVGDHVVRVCLAGPDRGPIKPYERNVLTTRGKGAIEFALPLNAAKGEWTVRAHEVVSGTSAQGTFVCR